MNPTLIGLSAVILWGIALPFIRMIQEALGILVVMGTVYTGAGTLGVLQPEAVGD